MVDHAEEVQEVSTGGAEVLISSVGDLLLSNLRSGDSKMTVEGNWCWAVWILSGESNCLLNKTDNMIVKDV